MNNIDKNINECDGGVPNGLTPSDVGGMGEISFPDDGAKGSGDLPSTNGVVYKQIASFGDFVKKSKKKKTFKTPITPDSPYYKKLKSSEYYKNFVYDFEEYMKKAKE